MIHMQLNSDVLKRVEFLTGNVEIASQLPDVPALVPFDDRIVSFLNDVSKELLKNRLSKVYSDVVTFAFWIRTASRSQLSSLRAWCSPTAYTP